VQSKRKFRHPAGPVPDGGFALEKARALAEEKFGMDLESLIFGNTLYHNVGAGRFEELSDSAGMETFWPWGVAVGDFDCDGYEDVFLPSGMGFPYFYWPSSLMRNNHDGTFSDITGESGIEPPLEGKQLSEPIGGRPAVRSSRCAATADFDNDGRLDLIISNFNDRPYYFKNQFPQRHYIAFRLRGTRSNRDAVGALVKLTIGRSVMVRQVHATGGYLSQSSKTLHFGLGDAEKIDRAEIHWPSGLVETIESPEFDRLYRLTEGESDTP
jgi:hypothetical protein